MSGAQRDEANDGFAFDFVGARDYGSFSDRGVAYQDAFNFHRTKAVAGDFDDVVNAAEDPDVAVLVTLSGVAREIYAIDCAEHRWPRLLDCEVAGVTGADGLALHIHNAGGDPGERKRCGAGFCGCCAGQRRNHDGTGFGLPPGVHDRAAIFADGFEIPFPRSGIDWLADGAENAKARQVVRFDPIYTPSHERADSGSGAVKNRYFVTVDDFPEAVLAREIGSAFVHHDGG